MLQKNKICVKSVTLYKSMLNLPGVGCSTGGCIFINLVHKPKNNIIQTGKSAKEEQEAIHVLNIKRHHSGMQIYTKKMFVKLYKVCKESRIL